METDQNQLKVENYFKRSNQTGDQQEQPAGDTLQHPETTEYFQKWLVCTQCGNGITKADSRVSIDGGHRHTFANPHGIVFEIGCFSKAGGCRAIGEQSSDFTWFKGYRWRIAICDRCATHMGWIFLSDSGFNFYGLILDRLHHESLA